MTECHVQIKRIVVRCVSLLLLLAALLVHGAESRAIRAQSATPRINIPYTSGTLDAIDAAITWFGAVGVTSNYADVRMGYNDEGLILYVHIFDRRLWFDESPIPSELESWDAVTLYLNVDGSAGSAPGPNSYRFVSQLYGGHDGQGREPYQTAYRGNGTDWVASSTPFETDTGWRAVGYNGDQAARGWIATFLIPYDSLGLTKPAAGTVWGAALELHDRDDSAGTPIPVQTWPQQMTPDLPATWGQIHFGMPRSPTLLPTNAETVAIRQGIDGTVVPDAHVGGHTECGGTLEYWTEWGNANYAHYTQVNIQNQWDVADWPCFSKYYLTFPLDSLPTSKPVISAMLTVYQFSNAGGPGAATPSRIQALTVDGTWSENTITWNNAPPPGENVAATWVDPISSDPGWPGIPVNWNVTRAVVAARKAGEPLRLVLYSADGAYNSGKYFSSSDVGDWNAEGRPTLSVTVGDPVEPTSRVYVPLVAQ